MRFLSELFNDPSSNCFAAYPSRDAASNITTDPLARHILSSQTVSTVGHEMSCITSKAATNIHWLELASDLGLGIPLNTFGVANDTELVQVVQNISNSGTTLIHQHREPDTVVPAANSWIDLELLGYCNNKANLQDFCDDEVLARRCLFNSESEDWNPLGLSFPYFIKMATNWSTGGGYLDVHLINSTESLDVAKKQLGSTKLLVQEEFIDVDRWYCINGYIDSIGGHGQIGAAEILCQTDGGFLGNRLGSDITISKELEDMFDNILETVAKFGYRGILGIDAAQCSDGTLRVIDLNCRLCGSTAPLLAWPSIQARTGSNHALTRSFALPENAEKSINTLRSLIRDGIFFPLGFFDPSLLGITNHPCRVNGLILGEDRERVDKQLQSLVKDFAWN